MKKRKLLFVLVLAVILIASSVSSFAAPAVNVVINDKPVEFTESSGAPFIDANNRTLVPLRAAMEAYGCDVTWDKTTRTATVIKDGVQVDVPIGQSYVLKDGVQVPNDTEAVIVNSRTYIPIRVVLESFGATVQWDNATKSVGAFSNDYYKYISGDLQYLPDISPINELAQIHVNAPEGYRYGAHIQTNLGKGGSNSGGMIGRDCMYLVQSFGGNNLSFTANKMTFAVRDMKTGENLLVIEKPLNFQVKYEGKAPEFTVKRSGDNLIVTLVGAEADTSANTAYELIHEDSGLYPVMGDTIENNQIVFKEMGDDGAIYWDFDSITDDTEFRLVVITDISSKGFTTTGIDWDTHVHISK